MKHQLKTDRHGVNVWPYASAMLDESSQVKSYQLPTRSSINFLAVLVRFFCTAVLMAVIVLNMAVMDFFWGRYRLWPSLMWPLWFVAVRDVDFHPDLGSMTRPLLRSIGSTLLVDPTKFLFGNIYLTLPQRKIVTTSGDFPTLKYIQMRWHQPGLHQDPYSRIWGGMVREEGVRNRRIG